MKPKKGIPAEGNHSRFGRENKEAETSQSLSVVGKGGGGTSGTTQLNWIGEGI